MNERIEAIKDEVCAGLEMMKETITELLMIAEKQVEHTM